MPETVYVVQKFGTISRKNKYYHTDPECPRLSDQVRQKNLETVRRTGAKLCKHCSGEIERHPDRRKSLDRMISEGIIEIPQSGNAGMPDEEA